MNIPTTGLNRNIIDKFYTKDSVVDSCMQSIQQHLNISIEDLIIEPSAGNGVFMPYIKSLTSHYRFYDLEPDHPEIMRQDYLLLPCNILKGEFKKIHIIGNPPFGRQSSLAIQFIKKSCGFCDSISFILPKSFKKESLQKAFSLKFHLLFEVDLPDKSFLVDGVEYGVDTVFQIWEKKDYDRILPEKVEPRHFAFVSKNDNPDISFRRVGVYAGKIDVDIEKSEQSHYFIKFDHHNTLDQYLERLKNINFQHNNTVGPRSISKQELIREFNKCLYI